MNPDELNMWVKGVPVSVFYIETDGHRIRLLTLDGRDYSFDIAALKKALKTKPRTGGD